MIWQIKVLIFNIIIIYLCDNAFLCTFVAHMPLMMPRVFIFLLSFYCLFLAVLPCHCSEPEADRHAHIASVSQQKSDAHRMDSRFCTPFCICSGVHNPNFFVKSAPLLVTVVPVILCNTIYTGSTGFYHRIDIWRPPKEIILL